MTCYNEDALSERLEPYIGRVSAFRFEKSTDHLLHTTHWSNADELLDYTKSLAATIPDGKFPTEQWLRKRGKWANRPGEAYNTLSIYIKTWIGGVRKLRILLEQGEMSTRQWDRETAIEAYKNFFEEHGFTPEQARHKFSRHGELSVDIYRESAKISIACQKYAGGAEAVQAILNLNVSKITKWSREKILNDMRELVDKHQKSPAKILEDHKNGVFLLSEEERRNLAQLVDASSRVFGGAGAVLNEIGFVTPSRPRKKRRRSVRTG